MLLVCASIALTGCASFKQEAGFEVEQKSGISVQTAGLMHARQEPWHNVAIIGDIRQSHEIAVAVVNMPNPLPDLWREELVDKARTYTVLLPDGRKVQKPLERVVFRAIAYTMDGNLVEVFDAVVTPSLKGVFVLLPADRDEALKSYQFAIISSDAAWLMTSQREMIPLEEGQDLMKLPVGFFKEHPSPLWQSVVIQQNHPVFEDILNKFSNHFKVNGIPYSGRPDAEIILSEFTSLETGLDKVVSCGSFTVSPGMVLVGAVVSVARNIWVANQKDCLK